MAKIPRAEFCQSGQLRTRLLGASLFVYCRRNSVDLNGIALARTELTSSARVSFKFADNVRH